MCGILYRVRNNLTPESLTSIYYTLCYPTPTSLTVCVSVWACTWPSFIRKISIAQNKISWCIFYMSRFASTRNIIFSLLQMFINIFCYYYVFTSALHSTVELSLSVWYTHHTTPEAIMSISSAHTAEHLSLNTVYCSPDLKYGINFLYKSNIFPVVVICSFLKTCEGIFV